MKKVQIAGQQNNKDNKNKSNFIQCFVEVGCWLWTFLTPLAISSLWFKGIFLIWDTSQWPVSAGDIWHHPVPDGLFSYDKVSG